MDKFPEDLNRDECHRILTENQKTLIKECRKLFYDEILQSMGNSCRSCTLKFPEKLWGEYRVQVATELLDRFGELTLFSANGKAEITTVIAEKESISTNIDSLKIDF